ANDERLFELARVDRDLQRAAVALFLIGQGHVAHLIQRIGGVGDELANRDLAALVEGMGKQVKKLLDLGLKREFLLLRRGCHRRSSPLVRFVFFPASLSGALGAEKCLCSIVHRNRFVHWSATLVPSRRSNSSSEIS